MRVDRSGLQTLVDHVNYISLCRNRLWSMYISLGSAMTSSNDQLDQMVWLSLRPFWWSRNAFGDKFRRQKYFTETIKGICISGFKIRAKIEVNEHLSVRLTSQTSLPMSRVMPVGSAFQFGFLPSQHCFLLKSTFQFMLHRGKPTVSLVLSPPLDHRLVSAPVNQTAVEVESSGFTP